MEYQVPQFIDVEEKIVGPFTFKQFVYIAGTTGLCVASFSYLPFIAALLVSLPIGALGAALAFYKVNGKPFVEIAEAGFNYFIGEKLLLWRPDDVKQKETAAQTAAVAATAAEPKSPRLTRGRLSELAWSLDVKSDASREAPM